MQTNYTKGEWEIRDNRIFIKDTYRSIAIIEVKNNFDIIKGKAIEDVEQIANAKLISAAPNMLDNLEKLTNAVIELRGYEQDVYIKDELIEKCINAINKATK